MGLVYSVCCPFTNPPCVSLRQKTQEIPIVSFLYGKRALDCVSQYSPHAGSAIKSETSSHFNHIPRRYETFFRKGDGGGWGGGGGGGRNKRGKNNYFFCPFPPPPPPPPKKKTTLKKNVIQLFLPSSHPAIISSGLLTRPNPPRRARGPVASSTRARPPYRSRPSPRLCRAPYEEPPRTVAVPASPLVRG